MRRTEKSLRCEAAFRARLAELGAEAVYEKWEGTDAPHRVICKVGHECHPRPNGVLRGKTPCLACVGGDPVIAEAKFRDRLAELGATPMWDRWLGNNKPHRAICRAGHECWPIWAHLQKGCNPCSVCSGRDAATLDAAFRRRLAALGVTPAYDKWLGVMRPHRVICSAGHECWPTPTNIQRGQGACRSCAGKTWDVFYVVANDATRWVKLGVTSGDPGGRLRDHRREGYGRLAFLAIVPSARVVELHVLEVLAKAGHEPLRGREYFATDALDVILGVARLYSAAGELAA